MSRLRVCVLCVFKCVCMCVCMCVLYVFGYSKFIIVEQNIRIAVISGS